jgi:hypothetical protein
MLDEGLKSYQKMSGVSGRSTAGIGQAQQSENPSGRKVLKTMSECEDSSRRERGQHGATKTTPFMADQAESGCAVFPSLDDGDVRST